MDYALTAEQEAFRAALRRFATDRLAPHYRADDLSGDMAPTIRADMAGMGLLGLRLPSRFGGQDAEAETVGVAVEELSRANINAAYLVLSTALVGDILLAAATPGQQEAWLPGIADGSTLPALALTEPGHGSDAAAIDLVARPDGDGWTLHGEKTSISLAHLADTVVVFARTGGPGARGVSAFHLPLTRPGLAITRLGDVANRAAGRCSLYFDGVRVGRDEIVGPENGAFGALMRGFEYSRAIIGLMALGVAGAALDDALEYARTRETFGAPIGTRQGVAFPLVEYATQVAGARHLCFEALWRKDRGLDHTTQANMVKWWAPKLAVETVHQCLLTFGHAAWSDDNPQAQRLRDAMGFEIADGTAQIAKLVVARALLGRACAP
ncbi:acyl-CoA dehydrogenase family protein [Actinomycetospora sp.]|uniref:acyl-CoA dehydrogenase family protein n=1 Tax=Actinomycetospora sp. TaxID=1872135 RepID=UPI002F3FB637